MVPFPAFSKVLGAWAKETFISLFVHLSDGDSLLLALQGKGRWYYLWVPSQRKIWCGNGDFPFVICKWCSSCGLRHVQGFFYKCKCIRIRRSIHDVYKGTKKPKMGARIQKPSTTPYKEPIQSTNSNNDNDPSPIYILTHSQ